MKANSNIIRRLNKKDTQNGPVYSIKLSQNVTQFLKSYFN
jgi:hypothetical protein